MYKIFVVIYILLTPTTHMSESESDSEPSKLEGCDSDRRTGTGRAGSKPEWRLSEKAVVLGVTLRVSDSDSVTVPGPAGLRLRACQ